jgi:hypothetical protein
VPCGTTPSARAVRTLQAEYRQKYPRIWPAATPFLRHQALAVIRVIVGVAEKRLLYQMGDDRPLDPTAQRTIEKDF